MRVWQWLTAQQERQWTRPTTVVAVAALEEEVVVAAEMAVEEQVAVEQAMSVIGGSRHRLRHRHRRGANGTPRSCVLESGRWVNLPHARREAAGAIAVVQVCKQQRKQQWRCRFHDGSSGRRRSQCKYAPEGHVPAEDGADVLDPLVAAKLESLVGLMQVGLGRQQQEQLHQLHSFSFSQCSCSHSRQLWQERCRLLWQQRCRQHGQQRCSQRWQQRCGQRWQ